MFVDHKIALGIENRKQTSRNTKFDDKQNVSKKIIKKIKEALNFKIFSMEFVYKFKNTDTNEILRKEKATVIVDKNKYFLSGDDCELRCDGKILWQYMPSINQLQIVSVKKHMQIWSFLSYYEKFYQIQSVRELSIKGNVLFEVNLIANSLDNDYQNVQIFFSKNFLSLLKIKIMEDVGIEHILKIYKYNKKKFIKDSSVFCLNYNNYKNLKIIDLTK